MSEMDQLQFPDTVKYSKEHTWARPDGDLVVVGISDYAQDQLGEIVFVELPEIGAAFAIDEEFGVVESVKTASDLYMPVGGEVVEVNQSLEDGPEVINSDPFGEGWMMKIKAVDPGEIDTLLDAQGYFDNLEQ
ncbi:MAG: glycine cleavage system protein GcvH [Deltaproteobacteria bacterium]|nr:glycine cleavage system protein GcvH [Deltaproteobacteria bacterium]